MKAKVEFDIIHRTIMQEKCILIIGPEVFVNKDEKRLDQQIKDKFDLDNSQGVVQYGEGLYFFKEGSDKTKFQMKMEDFFQSEDFESARELFSKIAEIPFHFIINLNPDKLLYEAYEKMGFDANFDFYFKNHPPGKSTQTPTSKTPLIYNMFGEFKEWESLILTHDDLFDYFESIFKAKSMDPLLKSNIQQARNIILLGIRYERWYMQLLLRILYLHTDKKLLRYASNIRIDRDVESLCYDHFRINFVQSNLPEFINTLHEYFKKEGDLKKKGDPMKPKFKKELEKYIQINDMDGALNFIKTQIPEFPKSEQDGATEKYNRLKGSWKDYKQNEYKTQNVNPGFNINRREELRNQTLNFAVEFNF